MTVYRNGAYRVIQTATIFAVIDFKGLVLHRTDSIVDAVEVVDEMALGMVLGKAA